LLNSNKILQGIGIPHSALLSVIFGMMVLSFPIGAFVVFHSEIGGDINFEYPLNQLELLDGIFGNIPFEITIGDGFIFLWSLYIIFFTISMLGPKDGFLKTLSNFLSRGNLKSKSNYLVSVTKWFSILILVSAIITIVQEYFGISITPPKADNDLIQFFYVSLSPLVEEIGFRVILIGLPLYAFYSNRTSIKHFFKSLWYPDSLNVYNSKRAIILIVLVAIIFGLSHILSGEPWSNGKFAQATASGIILGWIYFRVGLVASILVHWATNYFIFSYAHFISQISLISVEQAFSHSLINTMEIIFVLSGGLSVCVLFLNYFYSKRKESLQV
jgi:hypothetical protein